LQDRKIKNTIILTYFCGLRCVHCITTIDRFSSRFSFVLEAQPSRLMSPFVDKGRVFHVGGLIVSGSASFLHIFVAIGRSCTSIIHLFVFAPGSIRLKWNRTSNFAIVFRFGHSDELSDVVHHQQVDTLFILKWLCNKKNRNKILFFSNMLLKKGQLEIV